MTISRRQLFRLSGAGVAAASFSLPSIGAAESASPVPSPNHLLHPVQELDTSGARAVAPFELDGKLYLAIPQLAQDIDGQPAHMNGGDSDVSLIVYQHQQSGFVEYQRLPVSGGEDAEFFRIGDRAFLATASIRSGRGPYSYNVDSTIFEWREGRFERFQSDTDLRRQAVAAFQDRRADFPRAGAGHFARQCDCNEPVQLHDIRVGWQHLQAFPIDSFGMGIQLAAFLDFRRPLPGLRGSHAAVHDLSLERHRLRTVPDARGQGRTRVSFLRGQTAKPFWPSPRFSETRSSTAGMERPSSNTRS